MHGGLCPARRARSPRRSTITRTLRLVSGALVSSMATYPPPGRSRWNSRSAERRSCDSLSRPMISCCTTAPCCFFRQRVNAVIALGKHDRKSGALSGVRQRARARPSDSTETLVHSLSNHLRHVRGLRTLLPLNDFELHPVAFGERLEARARDRTVVHEDVRAALA